MSNSDLVKKLKRLSDTEVGGKPADFWVASSKSVLMSQIQPQTERPAEKTNEFVYFINYISEQLKFRVLRPAVAMLLIISLMLGYTATISVANASLPGDALYPVKAATEKVQLALTFSDDKKVQLHMGFVSRRLDELQAIVKTDDSEKQAQQVITTVKKITEDVNSVQKKLTNITSNTTKDVDTKLLVATKTLTEANNSLSEDVQKEISNDIKEAIDSTEDTGTNALIVIVAGYEGGDEQITDEEVTSRVAERIKSIEDNIQIVEADMVELVDLGVTATSTATTSVEILEITEIIDENTTSTIGLITETKDRAEAVVEEAKDLLDQKDFGSALAKIQEGSNIVEEATEHTTAGKEELAEIAEETKRTNQQNIEIIDGDDRNSTNTDEIIGVISTSTALIVPTETTEVSESTESLLTE